MLRDLERSEFSEAADYLDSRTAALRWLVALLRNWTEEGLDPTRWRLWCCAGVTESGLQGSSGGPWEPESFQRAGPSPYSTIAAARLRAGTLYVTGDPGAADFSGVEAVAREQVRPLRIAGDASFVDSFRANSRTLDVSVVRSSRYEILAYEGETAPVPGFRPAREEDLPVIAEYARQLYAELGELDVPEVELWIENGLVYVIEEQERISGMVLSNLSDGRYVHAGGVFVHPARRGRGIGRRLAAGLGAMLLREEGLTAILDAYEDNSAALKAYRAAGYRKIGEGCMLFFAEGAWSSSYDSVTHGALPEGG